MFSIQMFSITGAGLIGTCVRCNGSCAQPNPLVIMVVLKSSAKRPQVIERLLPSSRRHGERPVIRALLILLGNNQERHLRVICMCCSSGGNVLHVLAHSYCVDLKKITSSCRDFLWSGCRDDAAYDWSMLYC